MRYLGLLAIPALIAAVTPFDLDCELPTGTPFDSIKIPKETPTGGGASDTSTQGGQNKPPPPPDGKPGETRAEDPKKAPPPKPPSGLPGVSAPSTIDYQQHLGWKPKDDMVDYQDPMKGGVATGPYRNDNVEKWDVTTYPPSVPNDLYVYAVTRFLMVMLHPAMLSEREQTQYLIEIGYPGHYAATATKDEARLKRMAQAVLTSVGPMQKQPPAKPAGEVAQKVYMDLISRYCYEADFGKWILAQPSEVTLPVLLEVVKNHKHPFLVRNAVFILRCYNTPEVVPPLRDLLMKTTDKCIRNRALAALVRWQDAEIVDWLCKQVGGADQSFQSYALWALGRIGHAGGIDMACAYARKNAGDGESLWAAIPALGWLGEKALGDKKKKIEETLLALEKVVPGIKDPPAWDGTGIMATRAPDPPNALSKILMQRITIALALVGRAGSIESVKKWVDSDVMQPNKDFFREVSQKLP